MRVIIAADHDLKKLLNEVQGRERERDGGGKQLGLCLHPYARALFSPSPSSSSSACARMHRIYTHKRQLGGRTSGGREMKGSCDLSIDTHKQTPHKRTHAYRHKLEHAYTHAHGALGGGGGAKQL